MHNFSNMGGNFHPGGYGFPGHQGFSQLGSMAGRGMSGGMARGMLRGRGTAGAVAQFSRMPGVHNAATTAMRGRGLGALIKGGKGLNFSSILTNSQKFLGTVNQFMPLYHQVKPLFGNAKVLFKVMRAVNKNPLDEKDNPESQDIKDAEIIDENVETTHKHDEILDANIEEVTTEVHNHTRHQLGSEEIQPPYYATF